jgi:formamidopyrimidine-DNA glycosylase
MPELPEVETVARQLQAVLPGERVSRLIVRDKRLAITRPSILKGFELEKVERMGKQIVITFSKDEKYLFVGVHLRMTGRLTWLPKNKDNKTKGEFYYSNSKSYSSAPTRASFICSNGEIRFSDVRRFGTLQISKDKSNFLPSGVEPLDRSFTSKRLKELLENHEQGIKLWLLRQDKVVGIGNIYASEILFDAQIAPGRKSNSLSSSEIERLCRSIKSILRKAISKCGTTFSDFQDSNGELGGYQSFLKVYKREAEPCVRCAKPIVREKTQGRSTFFCPKCQK